MKLIATRGIPASGKTHWANEQVEKSNGRIVNVCRDDIRLEMFGRDKSAGGKWTHEKEVVEERNRRIEEALAAGKDVISSDTNFGQHNIDFFKKLADEYGADFEVKDFYVPLSVAEERDAKRPNGVGPKVLHRFWRDNVCKKYEPTPGLPDAICIDLDGSLAMMTNRGPYDETRVEDDEYQELVGDAAILLAQKHNAKLIITSGRHITCKDATERWLNKHGFPYDQIFMRPIPKVGEKELPDWQIKSDIYEKYIFPHYNVILVLDDRAQVVNRLREMGLRVWALADGVF